MVKGPLVAFNKAHDAAWFEFIEGVQLGPSRQGNAVFHVGIGRHHHQFSLVQERLDEAGQAIAQLLTLDAIQGLPPALAVVPDHHPAAFHAGDKCFLRGRRLPDAPRDEGGAVGPGGGWVAVIGEGQRTRLEMVAALVREGLDRIGARGPGRLGTLRQQGQVRTVCVYGPNPGAADIAGDLKVSKEG